MATTKKQFIVDITSDDNTDKTTCEAYITVNGEKATFSDLDLSEKLNVVECIKYTLGAFARIVLAEMGIDPEQSWASTLCSTRQSMVNNEDDNQDNE